MANFDVSFLNPKLRKAGSGETYGVLIDGLDIKKSMLESDGKLSPGDYDLLIAEAQKLASNPGLTNEQRSNINVKIAQYTKDKSVNGIKESNDISRLKREVQDDQTKIGMMFSSDPAKYLEANAQLKNIQIDRLSETIDQLMDAGEDASNHVLELNEALVEYSEIQQALDDVKGFDGTAPKSNFAAYVVTNSQGEVVDLKIGRVGSQSGYLETNGMYGGLPLYGKVNRKEYGKNVFTIGSQTFQAADVIVPGPDGTMKPSVLIDTRGNLNSDGPVDIAKAGYTPVDLAGVRSQSAVRDGGWIEGEKGFLYQKQSDGSYKKYVNATKEQLGLTDNDILRVPRTFEASILPSVVETTDNALPPPTPMPMTMPTVPDGPMSTVPTGATGSGTGGGGGGSFGGGRPNTGGAPTERAPKEAQGIAQKAVGAVKGFLGGLFGK